MSSGKASSSSGIAALDDFERDLAKVMRQRAEEKSKLEDKADLEQWRRENADKGPKMAPVNFVHASGSDAAKDEI